MMVEKEIVWNSGGKSFQRHGAVMNVAWLEKLRWVTMTGEDGRIELTGW